MAPPPTPPSAPRLARVLPKPTVRRDEATSLAVPPTFDPEFFDLFDRGFSHENANVRRMAVLATAYPAWPEFRTPLERLTGDPDAVVREMALTVLGKAIPTRGTAT